MGCAALEGDISQPRIHSSSSNEFEGKKYTETGHFRDQEVKASKTYQLLSQEEIEQFYQKANGNIDDFYSALSQKVAQMYISTSTQTLELMNAGKLDHTEAKVFISERILLMSLKVLETIGRKKKHEYPLNVFKKFNKSQAILIGYLKMKYPRGGQTFVPGDLAKMFKTFNMVESPENDILRNAGVCFTSQSEKKIIFNIKNMLNKIIDELDQKFPRFQALLQEQVFSIEFQGQKKSLNYKIGRKLPQNVSKYNLNEEEELTITSPQIFRVIIKWVSDMEDFINEPQEQVEEKESFKTYMEEDGKVQFDEISPLDIEDLGQSLKAQLTQIKPEYQEQMKNLKKQMDIFNQNLLKILQSTERQQKYVPKNQAKIIKYAMYNTKIVSWLLIRKLIFVLKSLIKAGKKMKDKTNQIANLDLIKFNVTDLMRAMVTGSKKQIFEVYKKINQLEQDKKIKIIKIKNRFGTPLNDAMIIFMIEDSFLICQLQLILSESQGRSDKLKNIEFLNHFLYELQRSPYGVLSQLAVVLGYKDTRVNYENKITFLNSIDFDLSSCELQHYQQVRFQEQQSKPFLCSKCTKFYNPFESMFGVKYCMKCNIFICSQCIFDRNKTLEMETINKKFYAAVQKLFFSEKKKNTAHKEINLDLITSIFKKQKYFLREHIKSDFSRIKQKDIYQWLKKFCKDSPDQLVNLDTSEGLPFFFIKYKGNSAFIQFWFWNNNLQEVEDPLEVGQSFSKLKKVSTSPYDFILFFDTQKITLKEHEVSKIEKMTKIIPSLSEINFKIVKKVTTAVLGKKDDIVFIFKINSIKKTHLQGVQLDESALLHKKNFQYKSIGEARGALPNLTILKQNYYMQNMGLLTNHLDYFKDYQWKDQIKNLNFSDNRLVDISIILTQISNIENLYLSKNFISQIKIKKPLIHLKKFICLDNQVKTIEGLNKLPKIRKINFSKNKIEVFETLKLPQLKQLILSQNKFRRISDFQNSAFDSLENFVLSSIRYVEDFQNCTFSYPKLKILNLNFTKIKNVQIKSRELQHLECKDCGIKNLIISPYKIKSLYLNSNILENFQQMIEKDFPQLQIFQLKSCQRNFNDLPIFRSQKLIQLNFQSTYFNCIENLAQWNLPNLKKLQIGQLQYGSLSTFPALNLPSLQEFYAPVNTYQNIMNLQKSSLLKLKELDLTGDTQFEQNFPFLTLPSVEILNLSNFSFTDFEKFEKADLPSLQRLSLYSLKVNNFPKVNFPKLLDFMIYSLEVLQEIKQFQQSSLPLLAQIRLQYATGNTKLARMNFPNLKRVYLRSCQEVVDENIFSTFSINLQYLQVQSKLQLFPILNQPRLNQINLYSAKMRDLSNINKSTLSKLEILKIFGDSDETLEKLPKINLQNLKTLEVSSSGISSLQDFSLSKLPSLERLELRGNKFKQIPFLAFPKLLYISFSDNQMQSLNGFQKCQVDRLEIIQLQRCKSFKIQSLPFMKLPNLKQLNISQTNIKNIDSLAISKTPHLQKIYLRSCQIKKLPLLKLSKLKQFSIANYYYDDEREGKDFLQDIQSMSQWECPELQYLDLTGNNLKKLPKLNFPKLTSFYFDNNGIQDVTEYLQSNLPSLQTLYISSMPKLAVLPFSASSSYDTFDLVGCEIKQLKNIQKLNTKNLSISSAQISTLDLSLFQKCKTIRITDSQIKTVFCGIKQPNQKLKCLQLSSNKIKAFEAFNFPELQQLILSYNQMENFQIPKGSIENLKTLDLSENKLEKITRFDLQKLEHLTLSTNKLKKVDFFNPNINYSLTYAFFDGNQIDEVLFIPKCENLNLSRNKISNLKWINNIESSKLVYLYLDDNKIGDISDLEKINLNNLSSISLNGNQLTHFPKTLSMKKLTDLNLQRNKLKKLEILQASFPAILNIAAGQNEIKQFQLSCRSIENIMLGVNKIEKFEIKKFPKLYSIYLNENNLKDIDWIDGRKLAGLGYLSIDGNKIQKFPEISTMKSLSNLEISNNPITDFSHVFSKTEKIKNYLYISYSINKSIKGEERQKIITKFQQIYPDSYPSDVYQNQEENVEVQSHQQNAQIEYKLD